LTQTKTATDKTSKATQIHCNPKEGDQTRMPKEIFDVDEIIEISRRAEYCDIKRLETIVKLKLRTPKKLYTLKVEPTKAEEIVKKLNCEIREI